MKKFTSALLAVTALTAANVFAAGAVDSKTGAYVGGNVGMANTNVKYNFVMGGKTNSGTTDLPASQMNNWKTESGKMNPLFGLMAGYGMQVGTMYFGGEVYGGFDSAKVTSYDDNATGRDASAFFVSKTKRTNFYGIAARLGAFVTPSTMLYAKLGVEGGKWTSTVTNAANSGGSTLNGGVVKLTGTSVGPFKSNKSGISFVPGLGLDAFITKNLFLRAEYTYLFGPKITVIQDSSNNNSFSGSVVTHKFQITQQTFKVGVGYKF